MSDRLPAPGAEDSLIGGSSTHSVPFGWLLAVLAGAMWLIGHLFDEFSFPFALAFVSSSVLLGLINPAEFAERLAASDGIDTKGLVPTQEELDQKNQAQQQQQMVAALGPQAIGAGGKILAEQMKSQSQAPEQPTE